MIRSQYWANYSIPTGLYWLIKRCKCRARYLLALYLLEELFHLLVLVLQQ
jgi:hypothetical protein